MPVSKERKAELNRQNYQRRKAKQQLALVGNSPTPLFDTSSFEDEDQDFELNIQSRVGEKDMKKELEAPAPNIETTPNSNNNYRTPIHSTRSSGNLGNQGFKHKIA